MSPPFDLAAALDRYRAEQSREPTPTVWEKLLRESKIPEAAVPYADARARGLAWGRRTGLRSLGRAVSDPVPWLFGRPTAFSGRPHWFDHGTCWLDGSHPVAALGQPYELDAADCRALGALSELGLSVLVGGRDDDWYLPGKVVPVLVTRTAPC